MVIYCMILCMILFIYGIICVFLLLMCPPEGLELVR